MMQSFDTDYYPNFYNVKETEQVKDVFKTFIGSFSVTFIKNNNLTLESVKKLVGKNETDNVNFGKFFLSNSNLVERFIYWTPSFPYYNKKCKHSWKPDFKKSGQPRPLCCCFTDQLNYEK